MKNLSLVILSLCFFSFFPNQKTFASTFNLEIGQSKNLTPPVGRLKKLKRTLLRSLWMDELIDSKKEFVKIELPEGQIIINGQILEGKLLKKYEGIILSYEISHGEKIAIHISTKFIKVGSFYQDCFRGSTYGTVKMKICDDEKESNNSLFRN